MLPQVAPLAGQDADEVAAEGGFFDALVRSRTPLHVLRSEIERVKDCLYALDTMFT